MPKFFDYIDMSLVVKKPEIFLVKEFKALSEAKRNKAGKWKKGDARGTLKRRMLKELTFVFLVIDWSTPYAQFTEAERWNAALEDAGLTNADIDKEIHDAIAKYDTLQETATMPILKAAKVVLDKVVDSMHTVDLEERDINGRPIFKLKDLQDNLKLLPGMIEGIKSLEDIIKKEMSVSENIKGDAEPGMFD